MSAQHPHFVINFRLLKPKQGGRHTAAYSDFRPQLWLGQLSASGERLYWVISLTKLDQEPLEPGAQTRAEMVLLTLPAAALSRGELLRFYEGQRLIGEGEILSVYVPGHPQDEAF